MIDRVHLIFGYENMSWCTNFTCRKLQCAANVVWLLGPTVLKLVRNLWLDGQLRLQVKTSSTVCHLMAEFPPNQAVITNKVSVMDKGWIKLKRDDLNITRIFGTRAIKPKCNKLFFIWVPCFVHLLFKIQPPRQKIWKTQISRFH